MQCGQSALGPAHTCKLGLCAHPQSPEVSFLWTFSFSSTTPTRPQFLFSCHFHLIPWILVLSLLSVKFRAVSAPTLTLLPHLSPKSWKCLASRAGCSQTCFLSHQHCGVEAGVLLRPEEGLEWCSQPWGGGLLSLSRFFFSSLFTFGLFKIS